MMHTGWKEGDRDREMQGVAYLMGLSKRMTEPGFGEMRIKLLKATGDRMRCRAMIAYILKRHGT